MFKSFRPKKFATIEKNNYHSVHTTGSINHNELCANCGYPRGMHQTQLDETIACPTDSSYTAGISSTVIPYKIRKPLITTILTLKVQQIRAFKALLVKYELDKMFAKRLKKDGFLIRNNEVCKSIRTLYCYPVTHWCNSYWWNEDERETMNKMDKEWKEICANNNWE